jgi:hypothetical protein
MKDAYFWNHDVYQSTLEDQIKNNNNTQITISKQVGGGFSNFNKPHKYHLIPIKGNDHKIKHSSNVINVAQAVTLKRPHSESNQESNSIQKQSQKGKGLCFKKPEIRLVSVSPPTKKAKSTHSKKKKRLVRSKIDIFS